MRVLVLFAHPRRDSFTGAIMDACCGGLEQAGHTVEVADLYREGFDPLLGPEDYAQFEGRAMPDDVLAEQARVQRAEALVLAFPVWWWSFPAVLKGWFDRVWSMGWAYSFEPGKSRGLLPDRPALLLCVAGSRRSTYQKYGYDRAMADQIEVGVLGYGGIRDVRSEFFYEVDDDEASRPGHLARARELGTQFLAPGRRPHRLGAGSLRLG
jgi:NAD(P)H dehydrogenase (quinone)